MRIPVAVTCIVLVTNLVAAEKFVYKFGIDVGRIIHTGEGNIPFLKYTSHIDIPATDDIKITYVEVTVNALSAPFVQYDEFYKKIIIQYSWTQITLSTYKILVKGI